MFTEEEVSKINYLKSSNPEFNEVIERFQEEQKYMLSSVTHELRNPLTLIYSTLQLMETKDNSLTQNKYWPQLKSDVRDTISLLQAFSYYNHSEDITLTNIHLFSLLQDLLNSFEPLAIEKNITLSIHASNTSYNNIKNYSCDYLKLKQAFTNIIKNAIEACQNGGFINVDINADPLLLCQNINGNTYMIINITNNGQQIPENDLDHIFEPFVSFKPCGSGMGLPISYKIIQNHNGSLNVFSDDHLTCFKVCLPMQNL